MQTEIITIGDEILIGQITDTNSGWIARELLKIGISVKQITTVSDEKEHILAALKEANSRAEIILITGGLGPTKDDITKQTICEFFNTKLVLNNEILEHVKNLFSSRNLKMPEINIKQAEIPQSCVPVKNDFGTAPGMIFEKGKSFFIFMPGVPYEMEAMMETNILPVLREKFKTPYIIQKTILTQGIGESMLMELIEDWENDLYKKGMRLAYLPSFGIVRLRITLSGNNKELIEELIDNKINELKKLIPQYFSGQKEEKPEEIIGMLLRENKHTISIAESCSGGYLSHLITSVPGSSDYFIGSVVSYSNEIKKNELGVTENDLKNFGAVSKEVVEAMANGIRKKFKTDYSIATSGIAGPTGGTEEKPVGTIWIAVASEKNIV